MVSGAGRHKKRIRLKSFDYKGLYAYSVTMCSYHKMQAFKNEGTVRMCLTVLEEWSQKCKFSVWAYCFMPDHLHLLVEGNDADSDFRTFVSQFKQKTGFLHKSSTSKRLWQVNYYEHVLRNEEDLRIAAEYIWENPVRKGLVEDCRKYRYSGSFKIDFARL
jgi:putative transposase